jgi:hypothetical protein
MPVAANAYPHRWSGRPGVRLSGTDDATEELAKHEPGEKRKAINNIDEPIAKLNNIGSMI